MQNRKGRTMKKYLILLLIILLLPCPVMAENYEVDPPVIYCYASSSEGHSAVNVIIQNDSEILRIADLTEDELYEEFGAKENSSLQIQFDYSVDEKNSWNYNSSWEPDRAGFFKSPVSLKVDAKESIIERKILDLRYDEYLEILSGHAYTGDNDGWKNVNLYDFAKNPVYIRARFIYTVEDGENNVYHNFISSWSEAVKVSQKITLNESVSAPAVEILSTVDEILEDKKVRIKVISDEEIDTSIMQLSHYGEEFSVNIEYKTDDRFIPAELTDDVFNGTAEYAFPVDITDDIKNLTVRVRLDFFGSEKYDIDGFSSEYAEENIIFSLQPEIEDPTTDPEPAPEPEPKEDDGIPVIIYIIPGIIAALIAGTAMMRKKR